MRTELDSLTSTFAGLLTWRMDRRKAEARPTLFPPAPPHRGYTNCNTGINWIHFASCCRPPLASCRDKEHDGSRTNCRHSPVPPDLPQIYITHVVTSPEHVEDVAFYWCFDSLEMRATHPRSAGLLLQLVGVKLVATAVCRGSGLVGGVYAPSLFMGAALGSAYAKLAGAFFAAADPRFSFGEFSLAEPQAYALVGMAAMLAGVCQVPLTAVLLLFELTQDYQIILPLMGAVGLSSWVSSLASKSAEEEKKRRKRQAEAERREQAVQRLQSGLSNAAGSNGAAVTPGVLASPVVNALPNPEISSLGLKAAVAVQTVEPGLLNYAPTGIGLTKPNGTLGLVNESMTVVETASDWLAASSKGPVLYTNGAPVFLREEKSVLMDGYEDDEGELCSLETSLCVAGPEVRLKPKKLILGYGNLEVFAHEG